MLYAQTVTATDEDFQRVKVDGLVRSLIP